MHATPLRLLAPMFALALAATALIFAFPALAAPKPSQAAVLKTYEQIDIAPDQYFFEFASTQQRVLVEKKGDLRKLYDCGKSFCRAGEPKEFLGYLETKKEALELVTSQTDSGMANYFVACVGAGSSTLMVTMSFAMVAEGFAVLWGTPGLPIATSATLSAGACLLAAGGAMIYDIFEWKPLVASDFALFQHVLGVNVMAQEQNLKVISWTTYTHKDFKRRLQKIFTAVPELEKRGRELDK